MTGTSARSTSVGNVAVVTGFTRPFGRRLGERLRRLLAGAHRVEPGLAPAARSRAPPRGPSGTRRTRPGRRARPGPAASSRVPATGIIGSSVPCWRSTAMSAARLPVDVEQPERGTNGLIASTPAGCGRSLATEGRARARARRPARTRRRPPRTADSPCSAHVASSRSSTAASASANPRARRDRSADVEPGEPGRRRDRARAAAR